MSTSQQLALENVETQEWDFLPYYVQNVLRDFIGSWDWPIILEPLSAVRFSWYNAYEPTDTDI